MLLLVAPFLFVSCTSFNYHLSMNLVNTQYSIIIRAVLRRQFPGFTFYIKDERYKLKNLIQIQGFFFVFNLIRRHSPPDIAKKLECLEGNDVIRSVLFAGSPVVSLV